MSSSSRHPSDGEVRYWRESAGGEFVPARSLPLTDRGFRYGMAVFETLRVHGGRLLFLPEHQERLERACRTFAFPVAAHRLAAAGAFLTTTSGNGGWLPPSGHGVARLHVTAGDGSLTAPPGPCRIFVSLEPREPMDAESRRRGLRVRLHPRPHHPAMGGFKTHNYWANLEALAAARQQGADEALLCGDKGQLISACLGNVFMVVGKELITPPLATGARPGVIREWVIDRFPVWEQEIILQDEHALRRTPLLVTNSWLGPIQASATGAAAQCVSNRVIDSVCEKYKQLISKITV